MLYMTLSSLEFLAGRMLLEIECLEFLCEVFAFRSGFNQKLKNVLNQQEMKPKPIADPCGYSKHLQC